MRSLLHLNLNPSPNLNLSSSSSWTRKKRKVAREGTARVGPTSPIPIPLLLHVCLHPHARLCVRVDHHVRVRILHLGDLPIREHQPSRSYNRNHNQMHDHDEAKVDGRTHRGGDDEAGLVEAAEKRNLRRRLGVVQVQADRESEVEMGAQAEVEDRALVGAVGAAADLHLLHLLRYTEAQGAPNGAN